MEIDQLQTDLFGNIYKMTYQLPNIREETEKRIKLLAKAKDNPKLQGIEMEMCKRNILYWCKNYVYTDKNSALFTDNANVIPMIPFPFQEELITEVWESIIEGTKSVSERKNLTNVFIEKSRQNGISWWVVAIFVYGFIFHNHKYLMISQKEDDVDKWGDMKSLFEKARFIIRNLPSWMLPQGLTKETGTEFNKFKSISRKDGSGSITGESANPNSSRWGTYNAVFLDEFGFMQNATTINTAAASATPCRIWNSTPNWTWNEQWRMRQLTMDRMWKNGEKQKAEVKGLRYHWSDNPLYTKEWYNWKIQGMTPEKIAQELEIDYNTAIIGRVYEWFPKEPMVLIYDPNKPLYVAMDNSHWWKDPFAIIVAQPDWVYWNIIDALEMKATPEDMASFLTCNPKWTLETNQYNFLERYKTYNWRKATFISDPYDTRVAMWNSIILEDFRKVWINLMTPFALDKTEQILTTRTNLYRIRYNENCLDFASAIMNARYPERSETSQSTSIQNKPVHDWTSHFRTALEYFFQFTKENPIINKERVAVDTRPIRDFVTWKLVYPK